ncbi:M16 family metallopeptidase [Pasteurella bettyae]|uniref:M16 family metallopeptidase n=1 Tax=Pasteurella bettyae TaxID=752 RepID=UPI003D29D910
MFTLRFRIFLNRTALLILLPFLISCHTTKQENNLLPFDPMIQHGQLHNGLNYFIVPNNEPAKRAYIRLVVNAGSMNEDDDQKGIAHLVEHMAFNGSKKFPENQIINALEQLGMKFARDINAFTDFENTVYTLNLDKTDNQSLSLAFDVVNEWMNNLTILPQDVDNERGIVEEEWRRRLSPMLRLGDKKSAIEMVGSRYVLRDPIGDMNIIRNISSQRVKDFYSKWYRPDNMSLIIVGDINASQVLNLISSKLDEKPTKVRSALEKINYNIPLVNHWRVATVSESGIMIPSIELSFFEEAKEKNTLTEYKQDLMQQIIVKLINLRLQTWEANHSENIDSANFYRSHLGKETIQNIFLIQPLKTDYLTTVKSLFMFIAQIQQQGFSETEVKTEIARLLQLNEKQKSIKSGSLKIADDLIPIAANKQIPVGMQDRYRLNKQFLNQFSLTEINQEVRRIIQIPAKLLMITQPYPDKKLPFNEKNIEQLWSENLSQPQSLWQQQQLHVEMPELAAQIGQLYKTKYWQQGDITEYKLGNGNKLIYHYSDKTPNQVYLKTVTSGGLRSVPSSDYHLLRTAVTLVDDTGVGNLPLANVNELFNQNPIAFATIIDDNKQGFTLVGKSYQLEDLLKLFQLKLQQSPVSQQALSKYRHETRDYFKELDQETRFMQAVSRLRYPTTPTVYDSNERQLLSFSEAQLSEIYQSQILAKTDFTYFIIGDIKQDKVEELVKKYLSNLPVKHKSAVNYQVKSEIPKHTFVMHNLNEPRADVEIYLTTDHQWSPEQQYQLDLLGDILQEKLRLVLREKESGIYSVNSWFSQAKEMPQLEGKIEFSCAPERADYLIKQTHHVLDEIMAKGIDPDLLQKKIDEKRTQIKYQFDSLVSIVSIIEESYWNTGSPEAIYLYQDLSNIASKANMDKLAKQALAPKARFVSILKP